MEVAVSHRVLIVDDEGLLVRTLVQAFREEGFDAHAASSAEQAQELLSEAEQGFDLLILDNKLPGMSGLDLLENLAPTLDRTQVVLMTAYDSAETQDRSRRLGVERYLRKPFDLYTILELAADLVSKEGEGKSLLQDQNRTAREGG
jgi:two-component system response regulator (stage 0 sporulation protein F)